MCLVLFGEWVLQRFGGELLRLGGLVVVFFCGYILQFEIVGFEHLITFETTDVIDSFSSRENLGAAVGTHARIPLFYALTEPCQELYLRVFNAQEAQRDLRKA